MDYVSEYLYWGDLAGLPFILENKTAAIIIAEVIQDAKLYHDLTASKFIPLISQFEFVNSFLIPWLRGKKVNKFNHFTAH